MTWVNPGLTCWMGAILACMVNIYTVCAAIRGMFMQIQGDLIFLMAYFTVSHSPPETPAVTPNAPTPSLCRHTVSVGISAVYNTCFMHLRAVSISRRQFKAV